GAARSSLGAGKSGAGREVNGDRTADGSCSTTTPGGAGGVLEGRLSGRTAGVQWLSLWTLETLDPLAPPPAAETPCFMRISRLARRLHSRDCVHGGGA